MNNKIIPLNPNVGNDINKENNETLIVIEKNKSHCKLMFRKTILLMGCGIMLVCMLLGVFTLMQEIKFDTQSKLPLVSMKVLFDDTIQCNEDIPFERLVHKIQPLGGVESPWINILAFQNSAEIKNVSVFYEDNIMQMFAVENPINYWFTKNMLRAISVGGIHPVDTVVGIILDSSSACLKNMTINTKFARNLVYYMFQHISSDTRISKTYEKYVECPAVVTPTTVCDEISKWEISLITILLIWGSFLALLLGIWFQIWVVVIKIHLEQLACLPETKSYKVAHFLERWLFSESIEIRKNTTIMGVFLKLLWCLSPASLPFVVLLLAGCDDNQIDCDAFMQYRLMPAWYVLSGFCLVIGLLHMVEYGLGYFNLYVQWAKAVVILTLQTMGVVLFGTNVLWLLVGFTVDPMSCGTVMVSFLSVFVYLYSTYYKLRQMSCIIASEMQKRNYTENEIKQVQEEAGLTHRQVVSISVNSALLLCIGVIWIIACSVIFTASTPGNSSVTFDIIQSAIIPIIAALQHVLTTSISRKKMQSATTWTETQDRETIKNIM